MKLLLDTHIFLWSVLDSARLSKTVASAIADPEHEIWLSPITAWECMVLAQRGKIRLSPAPEAWMREQLRRLAPREAPLNHEVALLSRSLALSHEDPADRFLAATAAVYELVLVTADERLLAGDGFQVLANT